MAMVRMRQRDHELLKKLADTTGESMSDLLSRAVEDLRRKHFLTGLAEDFKRSKFVNAHGRKRARSAMLRDRTLYDPDWRLLRKNLDSS